MFTKPIGHLIDETKSNNKTNKQNSKTKLTKKSIYRKQIMNIGEYLTKKPLFIY